MKNKKTRNLLGPELFTYDTFYVGLHALSRAMRAQAFKSEPRSAKPSFRDNYPLSCSKAEDLWDTLFLLGKALESIYLVRVFYWFFWAFWRLIEEFLWPFFYPDLNVFFLLLERRTKAIRLILIDSSLSVIFSQAQVFLILGQHIFCSPHPKPSLTLSTKFFITLFSDNFLSP